MVRRRKPREEGSPDRQKEPIERAEKTLTAFDEEETELTPGKEKPTVTSEKDEKTLQVRETIGLGRQFLDAGFSIDAAELQRMLIAEDAYADMALAQAKVKEVIDRLLLGRGTMQDRFNWVLSQNIEGVPYNFESLAEIETYLRGRGLYSANTPKGFLAATRSEIAEPILLQGKPTRIFVVYGLDTADDPKHSKYRPFLTVSPAIGILE